MKRLLILGAGFVLAACGGKQSSSSGSTTGAAPAPAAGAAAAPDSFNVVFNTTKGSFTVAVNRSLAPRGADRFYELVKNGYYNGDGFFRVVPGFVVQFGMNGDPKVTAQWRDNTIPDDSVKTTNARGTIVFANRGANTRSSQLFINLGDNAQLDGMGFSPFGRVVDGMAVVDSIYSGYGENPDQDQIRDKGNAYLQQQFPKLDYIKTASIASGPSPAPAAAPASALQKKK